MTAIGGASTYTGRCYCGMTTVRASQEPLTITYCHCADCRRFTGAPVAAFAAFDEAAVSFAPDDGKTVTVTPGATRSFCPDCGSPITGRYAYLPGQVYVAVGVFEQAERLAPRIHAHDRRRLPWLTIDDGLERCPASARSRLADWQP